MTIASERDLYRPVLNYLARRRWVGPGALVAEEFPLSGRLVDCALLTKSGRLIAIEFKLTHVGRVLWQATLNSQFFDRSIGVIASSASIEAVLRAERAGIELISSHNRTYRRHCTASLHFPPTLIRSRVRRKIQDRGTGWEDYVRSL